MQGEQITDDLELLLAVMPPRVREAIEANPQHGSIIEIVLDLGRLPEVRFPDRGELIGETAVEREDLAYVVERIARFGKDNRAGIARTLHRISAIRNRVGDVVGLTCRVGRAVYGTVDILRDVIESQRSLLLLGRPGVGKTTLLREAARVLAGELSKRVIVVDTSNEIAGDGDIPHPAIGRARRMQVPSPEQQHSVMIEAVENHMPQVIVIDEIGTAAEAMAARTIAERGVQLIATAHGNTLENLLQNPTLSDLVGGIQAVTLSDEEARRRGTQKTVLERRAPPTFDVLIEIQDKDRLAVHHDVAEVVDHLLRDIPPRPELRLRTQDGGVEIQEAPPAESPGHRAGRNGRDNGHGRPGRGRSANGHGRRHAEPAASRRAERSKPKGPTSPWWTEDTAAAAPAFAPAAPTGSLAELAHDEPPTLSQRPPRGQVVRVYAYAVSRDRLERAFRKMRVPALLVDDLDEADMVVTLKAQERRQPRRLREALERGVPLHIIKSNTIAQMESFVRSHFGVIDVREQDEEALREVEEAIDEALDQGRAVELPPRNNYLRRLQHQIVEHYGLTSESKGEEPYRRVVIYPG